jgi:hypothetical protein
LQNGKTSLEITHADENVQEDTSFDDEMCDEEAAGLNHLVLGQGLELTRLIPHQYGSLEDILTDKVCDVQHEYHE